MISKIGEKKADSRPFGKDGLFKNLGPIIKEGRPGSNSD
jgi:hypothetical protein